MTWKTALAAGLLALAAFAVPQESSASPFSPVKGTATAGSGILKFAQYYEDDGPRCRRVCVSYDYYGQCRSWRRVCDRY